MNNKDQLSKREKVKKVFAEICCFLLVVMLLYASISKLVDIKKFTEQMHNQPFPLWVSSQFVWLVPGVELLICLLIISPRIPDGKPRTIGLRGALLLMSLFTLYTALVLANVFGRIPCSCGGIISSLSWGQHLVFNLFFTSVAGIALLLRRKTKQPKPINDRQQIIVSTA